MINELFEDDPHRSNNYNFKLIFEEVEAHTPKDDHHEEKFMPFSFSIVIDNWGQFHGCHRTRLFISDDFFFSTPEHDAPVWTTFCIIHNLETREFHHPETLVGSLRIRVEGPKELCQVSLKIMNQWECHLSLHLGSVDEWVLAYYVHARTSSFLKYTRYSGGPKGIR